MENAPEIQEEQEEAQVLRAYVCGCGKCTIELNWGKERVQTSSPQIAAAYYRAMRKNLRFSKMELCLWGNNSSTRTQDKMNAIKAFHKCPVILQFLDQYDDWKKAVEEIREEVKAAAEPETILILVRNWNGEKKSFELFNNALIGTLRSKMREVFGSAYNANKQIYFGANKLEYLKSLDHYNIGHGSILKVE